MKPLDVYLHDDLVAQIDFTRGGKVNLTYTSPEATPLSLSLPNSDTSLKNQQRQRNNRNRLDCPSQQVQP